MVCGDGDFADCAGQFRVAGVVGVLVKVSVCVGVGVCVGARVCIGALLGASLIGGNFMDDIISTGVDGPGAGLVLTTTGALDSTRSKK